MPVTTSSATAGPRIGPLLQAFFVEYLRGQRRLSEQTIASYRDTFRLLLRWIERETGIGHQPWP